MTITSLSGIDHTLVGVRDLEGARRTWTRLGFTLSPRGSHIGWGTANYCIMFPDDYVELIGIVDPRQFTNHLDRFLDNREGMMGLAFQSDDIVATAEQLGAAGYAPDGPRDLKRRLELPEGTVLPEFQLVFAPEAVPGLNAFFCHHLTPELLRRPEWLDHANGAIGLHGATVVVDKLDGVADAYVRLFGATAVEEEPGEVHVTCGRAVISFVTRPAFAVLYPDLHFAGPPTPPYCAVMTVAVRDLGDTAAFFDEAGIAPKWISPDLALVPPERATGVALGFAV